jgi:hypothetical protein
VLVGEPDPNPTRPGAVAVDAAVRMGASG